MGIAKIDTSKRIVKDAARQVTFSKRRTGLFKKAFELSVLCELELAVVVFSQKEKVFTFAHPEIDYMIAKYRDSENLPPYDPEKLKEIHARVNELIPRYDQAIQQSKIGKEKNQWLKQLNASIAQKWWQHLNVDSMSVQQLQQQSDDLQGLFDLFNDYQKRHAYQQGSQLHMHQPQLLLPAPHSQEQMALTGPTPTQWQSRAAVVGDAVAAMPALASMISMQWQQPSSSNDCYFRTPNFPANMRPVLGSQNYSYSAAQPMSMIQRGMYGQQIRAPGVGGVGGEDRRLGAYYDQEHVPQDQRLITGGDQVPTTFYAAPNYMHQYDPVNQQNQQVRYYDSVNSHSQQVRYLEQVGRPLLGSSYPSHAPQIEQIRPGMNDTGAFPTYKVASGQTLAHQEGGFHEGSSVCGGIMFSLPYDPFIQVPGLPNAPAAYRNYVNVGGRKAQTSEDTQAEAACEGKEGPARGEVNSGPSSQKRDDNQDSSHTLKNMSALEDLGSVVDAAKKYAKFAMHESGETSQGDQDSDYTP